MTLKRAPNCGDWFKLVECFAMKKHGEYGEEVIQGDFFRFLGFSAAEGYSECYSPRLKSRFWIQFDYLLPLQDDELASLLEPEVPQEFKQPISSSPSIQMNRSLEITFRQKTKES